MRLSGGVGDVNPQQQTFPELSMTSNDTNISESFPNPVIRYPVQRGKAMVLEILKVMFFLNNFETVASENVYYNWALSTSSSVFDSGGTGIGFAVDPKVFAQYSIQAQEGSAATTGFFKPLKWIDLTDGAGHGVLVATDSMFFAISSANTGLKMNAACKILYRFKEVPLEAYIGIVQSQQ